MTEMPDFIRRAIEAQGKSDPDEVLAKAGDAIPSDEEEHMRQTYRRVLEEKTAPAPEQTLEEAADEQLALDRSGSRGGWAGTYEEGAAGLEGHKRDEVRAVQQAIIGCAKLNGEVHADDVAFVQVSERNVVGVAFRGLVEAGYLTSTGEHRGSKLKAAHGRKSYVYRLTEKGARLP